ncbi:MAG: hypothetical protein ACREGC_04340, partial [Minisyncoccia bacterium]
VSDHQLNDHNSLRSIHNSHVFHRKVSPNIKTHAACQTFSPLPLSLPPLTAPRLQFLRRLIRIYTKKIAIDKISDLCYHLL